MTLDYCNGKIDKPTLCGALKERDARSQLEMESSHFLHHHSSVLVDLFPMARFVLTVRDPLSWIQSEITQNVRASHPRFAIWHKLRALRYGRYNIERPEQERELGKWSAIWPIESYFKYWSDHHKTVLEQVPAERLLTIPVWEIENSVDRLCQFLCPDISPLELDLSRAHSGRSLKSIDLYAYVDQNYIEKLAEEHCGESIDRLKKLVPSLELCRENPPL